MPRTFDEPDLATHLGNVLDDYRDGLTTRDEAIEAIMERPELRLVRIDRRVIGPSDEAPPA